MRKLKENILQIIGAVGASACIYAFITQPSFPTPDKILIFLVLVFMVFKQAVPMLKRMLPFIAVLLVYESFRGFADQLNQNVNYTLAPGADERLFGGLPTAYLQSWLWHGQLSWYDFIFYGAYLLHFVLPIALVILIWKTRVKHYWQSVSVFAVVAFAAFATYAIFPAAPPWMAADHGQIAPITRVSSEVWAAFGLQDFPSIYNKISPNAVAAVPSLHAAWAALFSIVILKLYGRRWAAVSALYPLLIFTGTIYQGEHYAFDVMLGVLYAAGGYLLTSFAFSKFSAKNLVTTDQPKLAPQEGVV